MMCALATHAGMSTLQLENCNLPTGSPALKAILHGKPSEQCHALRSSRLDFIANEEHLAPQQWFGEEVFMFTILRDPADRYLSQFQHFMSGEDKTGEISEEGSVIRGHLGQNNSYKPTFLDYLQTTAKPNMMTHTLAGLCNTTQSNCLEKAKRNLQLIDFVATFDTLFESIEKLKEILNWTVAGADKFHTAGTHVNSNFLSVYGEDEDVMKAMGALTQEDQTLLKFASKLNEEHLHTNFSVLESRQHNFKCDVACKEANAFSKRLKSNDISGFINTTKDNGFVI